MTSWTEASPRRAAAVLSILFALGLGIRILYLVGVSSRPGFVWDDPDSYMRHGVRLAAADGGWRFDFEAVEHGVEGRRYVLPPLYPVFLSWFALLPGFPFNAQLAQAVLAALAILLVYLLGKAIHSRGAGLAGAALYALWLPNVIAVWSTMQEALYVPLVLLFFVLLLRVVSIPGYVLAGAVLGLAALTRSMPVYYLPLLVAILLASKGWRRGGLASAALVAGFALPTVPYSLALSRHLGAPTFIENHGGLRIAAEHGTAAPSDRPPGMLDTAVTLIGAFARAPAETVLRWKDTAASLLHLNGGRLLQIYLPADTRTGARFWKASAHLLGDLPLAVIVVLAPFGLVLCRRQDRAWLLAAWIVLNFGLTVLSGFGGARLRAPFEPHLMALAGVVLAGGFRRPHPGAIVAAAAVSLLGASALLPQVERSLAARGDYGVWWPLDPPPKRSAMPGEAGFNVLSANGLIELAVRPRNGGSPTRVEVSVQGEPVERVMVTKVEHRFRISWPAVELVYVELRATDARSGKPVRTLVVVPGRRGS